MELALDIIGERFTTLYQMSKPTYLSRDVFAPLEIGILTYINHGGHLARLPVSYTSSLSFCHSSHVVVYFILLSVVSQFCSGVYVKKILHTQADMRNWCLFHLYRVYFAHTVKSFLCEPSLSTILSYKRNVYQQ